MDIHAEIPAFIDPRQNPIRAETQPAQGHADAIRWGSRDRPSSSPDLFQMEFLPGRYRVRTTALGRRWGDDMDLCPSLECLGKSLKALGGKTVVVCQEQDHVAGFRSTKRSD